MLTSYKNLVRKKCNESPPNESPPKQKKPTFQRAFPNKL